MPSSLLPLRVLSPVHAAGAREIPFRPVRHRGGVPGILLPTLLLVWGSVHGQQPTQTPPGPGTKTTNMVLILDIAGSAEVLRVGELVWVQVTAPYALRAGDRFRTRKLSRATVRLTDLSQMRLGELSEFQVQTGPEPNASPVYRLWRGILYFFHREKPGQFRFETPLASAAVRGTEFTLEHEEPGGTLLTLFDGAVEVRGVGGQEGTAAQSGERILVEPGQTPVVRGVVEAELRDAVQWCLYYPAVLDLDELALREGEQALLDESLTAYRAGDLVGALQRHPGERPGEGDRERVYRAALALSVGSVRQAEAILELLAARPADAENRGNAAGLAVALRRLIAVAKGETAALGPASAAAVRSPTALLAESYVSQARMNLPEALERARQAVEAAPENGFAWARVAELEFGFGATRTALGALDRALGLVPRHAQALALRGFLLSAQNRPGAARASFEQALALDGGLGDAWLGRGLTRIRQGAVQEGLQDLQTAVLVEPRRAVLRSYLGKAYEVAGHRALARRELGLAQALDPLDPTPWLYSALLRRQEHQINDAVRDLEHSIELNDYRAVYRSRLLLDGDQAVRSSSLAGLYHAAGMPEMSLREAVRAVGFEYGNYSAHLFVSESFQGLREPTRSNLRYETVWFSEMLLANLLAPSGGTPLAQHISQQEYARFFEQDRLGRASATEYRSDGQWTEVASQFGVWGNTSWALDLDYAHQDGVRVNNELDRIEWYSTFKHQFTPRDSALLLAKYQDFHSGDTFQYYSPTNARPRYRFDETQEPILAGGYHHEWRPGVHSLLLGTRLRSDVLVTDVDADQWVRVFNAGGQHVFTDLVGLDVRHEVGLEAYGAEAQQIFENPHHVLVVGARAQDGEFETQSQLSNPRNYAAEFPVPPSAERLSEDVRRFSAYGYETLKLPGALRLTGGLTYEYLLFPQNFRHPPVSGGDETRERLLPKAALTWDPWRAVTVRGAFLRSLGGVSLDESYRLEPTQLAGFVQDYRTLIPETLASSVAGPDHEVYGTALDLRFKTRTYVTVQGQVLRSEVHRTVGAFDYFLANPVSPRISSTSLRQDLDFEEQGVLASIQQLLAEEWALGARYAFRRADMEVVTPGLDSFAAGPRSDTRAELQEVGASLLYNHSSGLFGQGAARWLWQKNLGGSSSLPDDSLFQLDLYAGYRLPRQRADLTVGVLNLTDADYHLNPVTIHPEFPRERVFYARVRFKF